MVFGLILTICKAMENPGRPPLLEALCLLSFAGSGTGFLLSLAAALFFGTAENLISTLSSVGDITPLSPAYFFLFSIFFLASLAGVFMMRRLRRQGFFIYMAARAAILVFPPLVLGKEAFSAVAIIFTLLFVVLYASQYKNFNGQ